MRKTGFLLLCLIGLAETNLDTSPVYAKLGETITISCFYQNQMAMHFSWYKHEPKKHPMLISTIYKYDHTAQFYNNFKNDSRFSVMNEKGVLHLVIRNIQFSDSAAYYCGSAYSNVMEVVDGRELIVKELEKHTVGKQDALTPFHSGELVNLTCTVLKQNCAGNHSATWLLLESQDAHPRIISAPRTHVRWCEWISEADFKVHRCCYSFSRKDLGLTDAGTFSCTVAACEEKESGNRIKLDIKGAESTEEMTILVLLSIARTSLLVIVVVTVVLWYCVS